MVLRSEFESENFILDGHLKISYLRISSFNVMIKLSTKDKATLRRIMKKVRQIKIDGLKRAKKSRK